MSNVTDFRWNEWNTNHATKHGVSINEAESVVRNAGHGFPRKMDQDKLFVQGRGQGNRMVQVIYVLDPDGYTAYIIHAMPLTTRRRR